ncbi:hypothetical protein Misp01_28240 [Microtetraspora sp. NBRC 13810]|nr:hypothetical protein Misp01_28240 [Microtetraspora sp. NBRC 13810]
MLRTSPPCHAGAPGRRGGPLNAAKMKQNAAFTPSAPDAPGSLSAGSVAAVAATWT